MTRVLLGMVMLLVASTGMCDGGMIELRLCPVEDIYCTSDCNGCLGVKVLHPRRRGVDKVIPSEYSELDVYDTPVAMLRVCNTNSSESAEIESLLGPDWIVEVATSNGTVQAGLMLTGSCRARYIRKVRPNEVVCLLVGRLSSEAKYKFRVGYVRGWLKCCQHDFCRRMGRDIVYSNWFQVDFSCSNRYENVAQEAVPSFSLCRIENNIRDRKCQRVKLFGAGCRDFVDLLLLVENANDFPICCRGICSGVWKLIAYGSSGSDSCVVQFYNPLEVGKGHTFRLDARGILAVPIHVNMSIEDYLRVRKFKIVYDFDSQHREAEMPFLPQIEDLESFVNPFSDGTNCEQCVSVEI